jgi:predicted nucleic acid-binding protein
MRVLLDTSAYSAFMRGHPIANETLQQADFIVFNPIVLGELRTGFHRGRQKEKNGKLLQQFLASPRVHIFPIDEETSERYAVILNALWTIGRPIPTNDLWIAATAMQHGLIVVTTDAHFQQVAQIIVRHIDPNHGEEP